MLDIKLLRENPEEIEKKLKTKDPEVDLAPILKLDEELRHAITEVEALKAKRNDASKKIGELKRKGEDASAILSEVSDLGDQISELDHKAKALQEEVSDRLARLPNIPFDHVKVSPDPADNVKLKEWGSKREFDFEPKNHLELSESLGLFNFKKGASMSGTGWPTYSGVGAELEWALLNYMLDNNRKNGFEQWMVPLAVRRETLYASGQLPKFENQQFHIKDDDFDLFMIPTAEVALNGLFIDEVIDLETLPVKITSYTPCFRREAGAAGEKERGLIRTHQFNKVELFSFTHPEKSQEIFDLMIKNAEQILEGLGLHYRHMELVTGDMSFASACTVDVETWLPGQDRYYEVSSISNCTDFQSRRSRARYRNPETGKLELVHTLNGSGLATSRLMVSLLENNQNADGSVNIPEVLSERMGGNKLITPRGT